MSIRALFVIIFFVHISYLVNYLGESTLFIYPAHYLLAIIGFWSFNQAMIPFEMENFTFLVRKYYLSCFPHSTEKICLLLLTTKWWSLFFTKYLSTRSFNCFELSVASNKRGKHRVYIAKSLIVIFGKRQH